MDRYRALRQEVDSLYARLGQVDSDRSEHDLVLKQLRSLDGARRCWHQVGAVLTERTVADVVPVLESTREKLRATVERLTSAVTDREKSLVELSRKLGVSAGAAAAGTASGGIESQGSCKSGSKCCS